MLSRLPLCKKERRKPSQGYHSLVQACKPHCRAPAGVITSNHHPMEPTQPRSNRVRAGDHTLWITTITVVQRLLQELKQLGNPGASSTQVQVLSDVHAYNACHGFPGWKCSPCRQTSMMSLGGLLHFHVLLLHGSAKVIQLPRQNEAVQQV